MNSIKGTRVNHNTQLPMKNDDKKRYFLTANWIHVTKKGRENEKKKRNHVRGLRLGPPSVNVVFPAIGRSNISTVVHHEIESLIYAKQSPSDFE